MLDDVAQQHHVSATQISTYRLCPRKWGFDKLDGIKAPPGPYAERGAASHAVLESWLDEGKPIDVSTEYGKIVAAGLKFLPAPGSGSVEQGFRLVTTTAIYVGFWDLWEPTVAHGEATKTRIHDHKTTSDFKWIKLPSELRKDPQAVIYATSAAAMQEREQTHVELNWIYYRANASKPGARKVQLHVLPEGHAVPERPADVLPEHYGFMYYDELGKHFAGVERTSADILNHRRQGHKAIDLKFNVEACDAFGGCPYRGNPCQLTMGQLVRGHMAQEETVIERMKKALAAKNGAQASVPASAVPAAAAPTLQVPNLKARMAAAAITEASSEVKAEVAEVKAEAGAVAVAVERRRLLTPPAVNPPESANPPPAPEPPSLPSAPRAKKTASAATMDVGLRDQFAGLSLRALIVVEEYKDPEKIAIEAYRIADAMLKARANG